METRPHKTSLDITLSELFESASSTNPTPGGGSVSALAGYLGISLVLKAIRISAKKKPSEGALPDAEWKLLKLAPTLVRLSQRDSEAFDLYIAALRLPKDTEEEKSNRQAALRLAGIAATEVALDILDVGNAILECSARIRDSVLSTIQADVRAGIEFASAMNVVARENANSNLAGLTDAMTLNKRLCEAAEIHRKWIEELGVGK